MNTYIVKIKTSDVRETLDRKFENVGKPQSLHNKIIINTQHSKEDIESIDGVECVQEDSFFEPDEELSTQEDAPWALSTICNDEDDYIYKKTGEGVDVYVIDKGVRDDHDELIGRVEHFYKPRTHDAYFEPDSDHGTAVASCVAGETVGVAKKATIKNAKTDYGWSTTLKILDKILADHKNKTRPSVVNMSFSSINSSIYDDVFKQLTDEGVVLLGSAGNIGNDVIRYPSGSKYAISVGATNKGNKIASFSSYGDHVDLYAPGRRVRTASSESETSYRNYSGTSFSTPYTAGVSALLCEGQTIKTAADVVRIRESLIEGTRKDVIDFDGKKNNHNRLLFSLIELKEVKEQTKLKRKQKAIKTFIDISVVFSLVLLIMYGVWQLVSSF